MMAINTSVEEVVIELLRKTSPCFLDDLVTYLPNLSWGEVFAAVDRMSRDGRLSIRQFGFSTYEITLNPYLSHSISTSGQKEPQSTVMTMNHATA